MTLHDTKMTSYQFKKKKSKEQCKNLTHWFPLLASHTGCYAVEGFHPIKYDSTLTSCWIRGVYSHHDEGSDSVYISGGGYSAGVSIYMLMNFVKTLLNKLLEMCYEYLNWCKYSWNNPVFTYNSNSNLTAFILLQSFLTRCKTYINLNTKKNK